MHDTPRTRVYWNQSFEGPATGLRLLIEPIGLHTPLLMEPYRPSRSLLGLRAPQCRSSYRGSFLVVFLGGGQGVLAESLGFLAWPFFQYTRYRMGFRTYADLSCASDKLCPLSVENSTSTNLMQPGALPNFSRTTAPHCVT